MERLRKLIIPLGLALVLSACGLESANDQPSQDQTQVQETSEKEKLEESEEIREEVQEASEEDIEEVFEEEAFKPVTITDSEGREIDFDEEVQRVVCIGPGALRFYTYINGFEGLVGVEDIEKQDVPTRPYILAYPEIMDLDTIGPGGPQNAPDAELLAATEADVIISCYGLAAEELDRLQEQTGTKVMAISYGKDEVFDPQAYESLENIGKITGKEARAQEVIGYMDQVQEDLNSRTKDLTDSPQVYIGGVGYRGPQGILSSKADFGFFNNVNANNVLDEITDETNVMLDKEKLLELDPEIIFIDLDGRELIEEDMVQDPGFYQTLSAFQNSRAYAIMPYRNYYTNLDTAMIDMYFIGSIVHPEAFEDVDLEGKAGEIFTVLFGQDLYDQMLGLYPESFQPFAIAE